MLNVDVKVVFDQNPANAVKPSGLVRADRVQIQDSVGGRLLGFDQLSINMADVQPLAQIVKLAGMELTCPTLNVSRDRAGRLNLLPGFDNTPKSGAARAQEIRDTAQNEP